MSELSAFPVSLCLPHWHSIRQTAVPSKSLNSLRIVYSAARSCTSDISVIKHMQVSSVIKHMQVSLTVTVLKTILGEKFTLMLSSVSPKSVNSEYNATNNIYHAILIDYYY